MSAPLTRLAVDLELPTPGLVNKLTNPTGAGGSVAGWVTPVSGSTLKATNTTTGPDDHGIAGDKLIYSVGGTSSVANYFYSLPFLVTPGEYIAARWKARYLDGTYYYSQNIEFLQADKTTSAGSTYETGRRQATGTLWSVNGPQLIPTGAVYARIRFNIHASDTGTSNPPAGSDLILQDVQVVTAATAAAIGSRRVNMITNGGAEDASAVGGPGSVSASITRQTTIPRYGVARWRISASSSTANQCGIRANMDRFGSGGAPVGPTGKVTVAASVRPEGATVRNFRLDLTYVQAGSTFTVSSPTFAETAGSYVDVSHTFTVPTNAGVTWTQVTILGAPTTTSGEQHAVDSWQMLLGETSVGVIFDHLTPDLDGITYEYAYSLAVAPQLNTNAYGAIEHAFTGTVEPSPTYWEPVTPAHAEIKIVRRPLDASTLATVLKPEQLPPGTDAKVKSGSGYRVRLGTEPLIVTTITGREPRDVKGGIPPAAVAAADAGRVLVTAPKALGVDGLSGLAWVLEDTGVAWRINGSSAQVATPATVATNNNAKAIDQVAMTRDHRMPAYAWVSRDGVVVVDDAAHLDPTERATITEADYSYFEQGYDVTSCINLVTVKVLSSTTDGVTGVTTTTTTTYGPFKDVASIEEWGEHPCTLTIQQNTPSMVSAQNLAQTLMTANAQPPYQVLAVTVPITRDTQDPIALLDLYDLARVQHAASGTDQVLRVAEVVHEITASKWIVRLRFVAPGLAAIPQVIPEP